MKRFGIFICSLILICACVACSFPEPATGSAVSEGARSSETAPSEDAAGGEEAYRVGLSMNSFDSYQVIWYEAFVARANELGIQVLVTNSDSNVDTQITDVENMVVQEMDAIVICAVDPDGSAPAFEACKAAGIPVIAGQFTVNADYEARVILLDEQYYNGIVQCDALARWLEEQPGEQLKCGFLQGSVGVWSADQRYEGFRDYLPEGAELIVVGPANWNADEATSYVEDWLVTYPELNCIAAANDDMAAAAINVLKAQGKTDFSDFPILGLNAQEDAVEHVRSGAMYATVYYDQRADAAMVADVTYAVLQGVSFNGNHVPSSMADGILSVVTIDNVETFAEEYSPTVPTLEELLKGIY